MDLLAGAGLLNYFGKQNNTENIVVEPVLIEKGKVRLALFGLGWVRDERLNRMFCHHQVEFIKPTDKENGDFFNLFVIHQNRQKRGMHQKNSIPESMIPNIMDLVIWGHEHECRINPEQTFDASDEQRNFFVSQPGSSVATSLDKNEAVQKKVAILDLKYAPDSGKQKTVRVVEEERELEDDSETETRKTVVKEESEKKCSDIMFRFHPIALKTVRPFLFEEITLIDQPELARALKKDEESRGQLAAAATRLDGSRRNAKGGDDPLKRLVFDFLQKRVMQIINAHRKRYNIPLIPSSYFTDLANSSNNSSSNKGGHAKAHAQSASSSSSSSSEDNEELRKSLLLYPLVRLKVDHTEFPIINLQKFAGCFRDLVANPTTILLFSKRSKVVRKIGGDDMEDMSHLEGNDSSTSSAVEGDEQDNQILSPQEMIAHLIQAKLEAQKNGLKVLRKEKLNDAVSSYVMKGESKSISNFLEEEVVHVKKRVIQKKEEPGLPIGSSSISSFHNDVKLESSSTSNIGSHLSSDKDTKPSKKRIEREASELEDDVIEIDDEEEEFFKTKKSRSTAATATSSRKAIPESPVAVTKKPTRGASRKKKINETDSD